MGVYSGYRITHKDATMSRILPLILCLTLIATPLSAQDATNCDAPVIDAAITDLRALLDTAAADSSIEPLIEAKGRIAVLEAACSGLSFEGTTAKVIGPFELEAGLYRVTADTEGFFIADLNVIDGSCEAGVMGMFLLMNGDASGGAETLVESEGCTTLVTLDNITDPWTLTFERIG
jgi:hypothetical protein